MRRSNKNLLRALSFLLLVGLLIQPAYAEELTGELTEELTESFMTELRVETNESGVEIPEEVLNTPRTIAAVNANFTTGEAGRQMILSHEGFAEHPIWDYGQWSIGHGTNYKYAQIVYPKIFTVTLDGYSAANAAKAKNITITREQAMEVFLYMLRVVFESSINSYLNKHNIQLNQNQFDALVDLTYQVGPGWMSGANKDGTPYKIRVLLEQTDPSLWTYDRVEAALIGWCNVNGKPSEGLKKRRREEAALFVTPVAEPEPEREPIEAFADVYVDDWYADAVQEAYNRGIMKGWGDGIFAPKENLRRSEMVLTLANMLGVDLTSYKTWSKFSDVPLGEWYTGAVTWGSETGLVVGFDNGLFEPDAAIQRQHVCVILAKFLRNKGIQAGSIQRTFLDADQIQETAWESVEYCVSLGVVSGLDDGTFLPSEPMSRAQIASVLVRMAKLLGM